MLPIHQIESFLQRTPAHLQEIVLELRNVVASVAPDAVEVVRWGGLSYFHEGRGGIVSAGICQIGIHKDHIRLAFIHGAFLSDPRQLLEGDRKYKKYIRITSYEDAAWDYLKQLIQVSTQFDPRSLQSDDSVPGR
jgi:hypothetical protein